jgi:Mn2+/Fe2+ NRAMP family transporter
VEPLSISPAGSGERADMERDINGVAAVPIVATIMLMASRESVMGKFVLTKPLAILGWLATAVIAAAANRHVRDPGS